MSGPTTLWTEDEDALLIHLYRKGIPLGLMRDHGLNRSPGSLKVRCGRLRAQGMLSNKTQKTEPSALKRAPSVTGYDEFDSIRESTRRLGEAWERLATKAVRA